ncbi:hypothetical protein MIND_00788400 [Mycena indigotica]|uniref:Uncharacterized protein n=1 Tax=Mycena indigotica TaxID=2126181 RepID=A0A8H6SQQ6_9AGAR|nr:uncharacterized protein MIND_00788400 [Mycena indigotica]KAF7302215.1 hypothetical protein MIND_00788400 [Mycena indigotica]
MDLSRQNSTLRKFDHTPNAFEERGGREVEITGRAPILNPTTRSGRGLTHDVTGGLCTSIDHDWSEESIRRDLRDNKLGLAPNYFFRVFYANYHGNAKKVEEGFLKSPLLVKAWLAIFMASASDQDENTAPTRCRDTQEATSKRPPVAELLGFDGHVPPRTIAYTAVLVYFALSDVSQWRRKFNGVDLDNMYTFLVDYFEDNVPNSKAEKRVGELQAWWNKKTATADGASATTYETAITTTQSLWQQRMEEEEDEQGEQGDAEQAAG